MENDKSASTWVEGEKELFFSGSALLNSFKTQIEEDPSLDEMLREAIDLYGKVNVKECLEVSAKNEQPLMEVLDHLLNGEGVEGSLK